MGSRSHLLLSLTTLLCFSAQPLVAAGSLDDRASTPAPIVIAPSGQWDGVDGPWSSFTVQVGNPPQSVNALISTASSQTWVVDKTGCNTTIDPSNCPSARGGLFKPGLSDSWVPNSINEGNPMFDLGVDNALGYLGKGRFGFDDVTLGMANSGSASLNNQTVASIQTRAWYMGLFGLRPVASSFSDGSPPIPSFLQNLRSQSLIPSTTWSYTAGAQYRSKLGVFASLTLGGYDASKFVPNNLTFLFGPNDGQELSVQVKTIATAGSGSVSLLSTPITMNLDSSLPFIYLPLAVCLQFEHAFGLKWDNVSRLYLVSDKQHANLLSMNPSITFTLVDATLATIDITLPYSAFDLMAAYPLVNATSAKYFPLRRTSDDTQYTLGRAFFQEAYVIADYDRRTFSIFQCNWAPNTAQQILPIPPPSNTSTPAGHPTPSSVQIDPSTSSNPSNPTDPFDPSNSSSTSSGTTSLSSHHSPTVAIAAGATSGLAVVLIIFLSCLVGRRRHKASLEAAARRTQSLLAPPAYKAELDSASTYGDRPLPSTPELGGDVKVPIPTHDDGAYNPNLMPVVPVKRAAQVPTPARNSNVFEMPASEVNIEMMGLRKAQTQPLPPPPVAKPLPPPMKRHVSELSSVQRRPVPIPRKPAPEFKDASRGNGRNGRLDTASEGMQQDFFAKHVVGSPMEAPSLSPLSATYIEDGREGRMDGGRRIDGQGFSQLSRPRMSNAEGVSPVSRTGSGLSLVPPRSRGGEGKVMDELWLV